MNYKVYVYEGYLKLIDRNIPEEDLKKYGVVTDKIYNNYKENNPDHIGFTIVKEINKGFTTTKELYYAFKEAS